MAELLAEGGISREELDHVVLAGSSCKIPCLQRLLEGEFPSAELHLSSPPPPDEAVATGCALQASLMHRSWVRGRVGGGGESWGKGEEGEGGVDIECVPYDLWIKVETEKVEISSILVQCMLSMDM